MVPTGRLTVLNSVYYNTMPPLGHLTFRWANYLTSGLLVFNMTPNPGFSAKVITSPGYYKHAIGVSNSQVKFSSVNRSLSKVTCNLGHHLHHENKRGYRVSGSCTSYNGHGHWSRRTSVNKTFRNKCLTGDVRSLEWIVPTCSGVRGGTVNQGSKTGEPC